jgi:hypothetical protein
VDAKLELDALRTGIGRPGNLRRIQDLLSRMERELK